MVSASGSPPARTPHWLCDPFTHQEATNAGNTGKQTGHGNRRIRAHAAYPDTAETPRHVGSVREYWHAPCPHTAGAGANFMMDEGEERIRGTYGEHYRLLATLKAMYDPTNLFHMNQNIKPTG